MMRYSRCVSDYRRRTDTILGVYLTIDTGLMIY